MGCDSNQVATLVWGGQERSLKRWCSTHILNHKQQPAGMSGTRCLGEGQIQNRGLVI